MALSVQAVAPASAAYPPLLTGVRASHQPGFDRVVFDFYGGAPPDASATFVDGPSLSADERGRRIGRCPAVEVEDDAVEPGLV